MTNRSNPRPHLASIALGDFNRDGKLDIVVGNTTANNISFFAGNGNNTFAASVKVHHSTSLTPSWLEISTATAFSTSLA